MLKYSLVVGLFLDEFLCCAVSRSAVDDGLLESTPRPGRFKYARSSCTVRAVRTSGLHGSLSSFH